MVGFEVFCVGARGWLTSVGATVLLLIASAPSLQAQSKSSIQRETIRIPGPIQGLQLALRHVVSSNVTAGKRRVVLVMHGTALPVSGNPDYPFGGRSMLQGLADEGLDVWALDFYGYGDSDRYPEMDEPAENHPPLGVASQTASQIHSAVAYLEQRYGIGKVMLIGDSGSTMIAGLYATLHPESVARLVLFAPVTPFTVGPNPAELKLAYTVITPKQLWGIFTDWASRVEGTEVLDPKMYEEWAAVVLRSDPTSKTRTPPSIRFPNGLTADLAAVASGKYTYDPGEVRAPTLIVMGETDEIATFAGAQWLLRSLRQAPQRRLAVIGRGSHTIQFEAERAQLYRVMADFLKE